MSDLLAAVREALAAGHAVEQEIGRGGMARVFRAKDLRHDRYVALKILDPRIAASLGSDRFLREITIASRLQHPNIVPLFDSGADADFLWYTMPLIEGDTLQQRVAREGPLPVDEAVRIARQVAVALAHAHDRGVVHRDIKPGNIMFSGDVAVVTDFGIARAIDEAAQEELTATGLRLGSVAYMSPEQWSADSNIDGRSDIYSLGCVLYEMLTGNPPFESETAVGYMSQHLTRSPEPLRETRGPVPYPAERGLFRSLEKDPAARFADATLFAEALVTAPGWRGRVSDLATDLWRRRVPHAIAAYLGATWAVVLLVRILTDRLMLSPDVTALALAAMIALLPSVILISFFHGGTGRAWPPEERAGIALNAIGAAAILFLLFRGLDLGPIAQPEPYVDSRDVERVEWVPASGQVRRVGLFFLENRTGDPELDWVSYAIPYALDADLEQDLLVLTTTGLVEQLRERGEDRWTVVPGPLQRDIARDAGLGWTFGGWFEGRSDSLVVTTVLSGLGPRTSSRKDEWIVSEEDILSLADSLGVAVKEGVSLPTGYLGRVEDLPAEEILTGNPEAFRRYVAGYRARQVQGDPENSGQQLQIAVELDPDFALAWNELSLSAFSAGDAETAIDAKQHVIQLDYRMPRWKYLSLLQGYYVMTGNGDRALAVAEERVERYPDDLEARRTLANLYTNAGMAAAAANAWELLYEIEPDHVEYLLEIARVHTGAGDSDAARSTYERYLESGGHSRDGIHEYALFLRLRGDLALADELYREALLLDPSDSRTHLGAAGVFAARGEFDEAGRELGEAARTAVSAEQRAAGDSARAELHLVLGRLDEARLAEEQARLERPVFLEPFNVALAALGAMHRVAPSVGLAEALEQVAGFGAALPLPLASLSAVGRWKTFESLEIADSLLAVLPEAEAALARIGMAEVFGADFQRARGTALLLMGNCSDATAALEGALSAGLDDDEASGWIGLSSARLACNEPRTALSAADSAIALVPGSPLAALARAEALAASNRSADARGALVSALTAWARADKQFGPAIRARALAARLSADTQ